MPSAGDSPHHPGPPCRQRRAPPLAIPAAHRVPATACGGCWAPPQLAGEPPPPGPALAPAAPRALQQRNPPGAAPAPPQAPPAVGSPAPPAGAAVSAGPPPPLPPARLAEGGPPARPSPARPVPAPRRLLQAGFHGDTTPPQKMRPPDRKRSHALWPIQTNLEVLPRRQECAFVP
ncbi:basic proline-rich protein-like [Prinia subflava]|uniref:basic proline-rich protein-like n=1 Tax=Prinia subflava TaxID=208062 RepID=UPI002FE132C7